MKCGNAFQTDQYLENCMTNRASFPVLKKGDMRLAPMTPDYRIALFFPFGK